MPDRVDAAVDRSQPLRLQASLDLPPRNPSREELGTGNHAVLGVREGSDNRIRGISLL